MVDTLMDTGPLVALFDRNDRYHIECTALVKSLDCAFYTTMQVITEAMYFLGRFGGYHAQEGLWKLILRGDLLLEHPAPNELTRMAELMDKYRDRPMDFADASLVALAERLDLSRMFTLDYNDFSTYRMSRNRPFTIIGPRPIR